MWTEIYNNVLTWMAQKKPEQWIISTIQNNKDMKNTYIDTRSLTHLLLFLEEKSSSEQALADGTLSYNGGMFSSIAGAGYDG